MVPASIRRAGLAVTLAIACAAPVLAEPAPADTARVALPPLVVRRWQVGLLRPDRVQHVSLSLTLGLAAGLLSRRPEAAIAAGLGLGLAKEILDVRHTGFDAVDLCADAIGSGAAAWSTAAIVH